MQTVISKPEVQNEVFQGYSLRVNNIQKLKNIFKNKFSMYIDSNATPTPIFINLLCNGDDILQAKIRTLVDIVPII